MEKHTRVYMEYFGYQIPEDVVCEITGEPATEVHHIRGRGPGKDTIRNLMALTRREHDAIHFAKDPPYTKDELQEIHDRFLETHKKVSYCRQ